MNEASECLQKLRSIFEHGCVIHAKVEQKSLIFYYSLPPPPLPEKEKLWGNTKLFPFTFVMHDFKK